MPEKSHSIAKRKRIQSAVSPIIGVVLAGGLSRRFDGLEKALQPLAGQPLIERVIDRARPQVHEIVVSTNGDPSRFSRITDAAVVVDDLGGHQGPLAGLAACLSWLVESRPNVRWVATFPVDSPFFPDDLVASLSEAALSKQVPAFAVSGGRAHPVFCLWPADMESEVRRYLAQSRRSPLADFMTAQGAIPVPFQAGPPDPFFNINTMADLLRAEDLIGNAESRSRGQD